ncbi:MAG: hypothetical protein AVDCRST_MAG49-1790 [uncultured Thermomicrobiales bacterium]|uniref:Uncharacterized protein n=1 Tax=uncultured Thermomicrobiales bacterium TaxID=1645740 RepID=A0A6J4UHR9_9BACT|nr:MAG: hypothetical protein AVDCRST_MAG49-1790 [uncultured Thermomicrobiales bacterium]
MPRRPRRRLPPRLLRGDRVANRVAGITVWGRDPDAVLAVAMVLGPIPAAGGACDDRVAAGES